MIELTTTIDKNFNKVSVLNMFKGKTLRERLEGKNRQDVCFYIENNPSKFSKEAVQVARHIKNGGGTISVNVALIMIEMQKKK